MISRTAAHMAAFRALETERAPAARLFEDRYARRFLSPAENLLVSLSKAPLIRKPIEAYIDHRAPGARTSGIARTRLIDDWLTGEVEDGAEQVIILGAGYDCRALRLPALAGVKVYELDCGELLARKAARLGQVPENLVRIQIDFGKESIEERLRASGVDAAKPTVFLWEGVTNYLDDAAVGRVLDCVAAFKAKLIFTYIHADAVIGAFDAPGLAHLLDGLRRIGEPWTFGLKPEALPDYLAAHGLRRRADLGAEEYRALYAVASRGGYEFYRVALAEPLRCRA